MKRILGLLLTIVLVGIDQLTKYLAATKLMNKEDFVVIKGFLSFHYLENRGVAWGMFSGKVYLFIVTTSIMLIVIAYVYFKAPLTKRFFLLRLMCLALCSGAIGNLIDRVVNQYVIDFIYFDFKIFNFPVFNVADIYVTVSAIAFVILVMFYYKEEEFDVFKLSKKGNE